MEAIESPGGSYWALAYCCGVVVWSLILWRLLSLQEESTGR